MKASYIQENLLNEINRWFLFYCLRYRTHIKSFHRLEFKWITEYNTSFSVQTKEIQYSNSNYFAMRRNRSSTLTTVFRLRFHFSLPLPSLFYLLSKWPHLSTSCSRLCSECMQWFWDYIVHSRWQKTGRIQGRYPRVTIWFLRTNQSIILSEDVKVPCLHSSSRPGFHIPTPSWLFYSTRGSWESHKRILSPAPTPVHASTFTNMHLTHSSSSS